MNHASHLKRNKNLKEIIRGTRIENGKVRKLNIPSPVFLTEIKYIKISKKNKNKFPLQILDSFIVSFFNWLSHW